MPSVNSKLNIAPHPHHVPLILAPAGNRAAFLAALAAGADAVYCGLKLFSARMEAKNFTIEELARLTQLAHSKNTQVYITLNSLVKPDELHKAAKMVADLVSQVCPDALIVQDLAFLELARQIGFKGELHLSTLANVTFPAALPWIKKTYDVTRVVMPRELSIDEIKLMAAACPKGLDLEMFVHGALCYGVSGRCYWSSWFGGKSGLRGRCVQPCRRLYQQRNQKQRYFSCQDFSVDVLAKVIKGISAVKVWKIEGRKKGPHYVHYTVSAYKLLRDHHRQPDRKRDALALLEESLGRSNTHYNLLSQRPQNPIDPGSQTGSGRLVGRVQGANAKPFVIARMELMQGDVLRIGYEDQQYHGIHRVSRHVPKKGRLYLKVQKANEAMKGAPVFLTDRREGSLNKIIANLEKELERIVIAGNRPPNELLLPTLQHKKSKEKSIDLDVFHHCTKKTSGNLGLWLSDKALKSCSKTEYRQIWWWLPPVIWPVDQEKVLENLNQVFARGGRRFVLNAPWQMALFSKKKGLTLWAGPFCNIANPLAIASLKGVGFSGVIVSPELGKTDYELMARKTPIALGVVLSGHWPLCISRTIADNISESEPLRSPKGEESWIRITGNNYYVFSNWTLDLAEKKSWLEKMGYRLFVNFNESVPQKVKLKKRPGLWNWDLGLA